MFSENKFQNSKQINITRCRIPQQVVFSKVQRT